ncbi:MAG: EamA family transporter [Thermoleophilia bacterium]|nr:EamA family transporter [Thermoleophilia bacterium]
MGSSGWLADRGGAVRSSRHMPLFILGFIVLVWGYLFVPCKLGVAASSAFVWAGLRTFPAYLLLLGLMVLLRRPLRPQALGLTALVGVLQVGGFVGFTSAALVTSGAGHTAMLANTWQLWILVMAWLVLQERLRGMQWWAVGVGTVGLVLIIQPWRLHGVVSSLFALAAALCFAGGAVAAKVLRRRHQVDLLSFTTWQGLLGSVPLVALAVVLPGDDIEWSGTFVWALAYSILIGTALAQVLWLYVLNLVPATTTGIANLATPIVSVLAAWIQLREHPSGAEIAGMVLVVAGLGLLAAHRLRAV